MRTYFTPFALSVFSSPVPKLPSTTTLPDSLSAGEPSSLLAFCHVLLFLITFVSYSSICLDRNCIYHNRVFLFCQAAGRKKTYLTEDFTNSLKNAGKTHFPIQRKTLPCYVLSFPVNPGLAVLHFCAAVRRVADLFFRKRLRIAWPSQVFAVDHLIHKVDEICENA